ncbi:MAG: glutathione binding-like protein [Polyangiaceae bacterium]|nr:glutathione binding-like protein [Polyangiaceae bacterium]
MDSRSNAADRFWRSTKIGYVEWHDGTGYDVDAVREMTPDERDDVVRSLRNRSPGWREVEVYGLVDTPEARAALREALVAPSAETRLHAAATLYDLGDPIAIDAFVAKELATVTIIDGMTIALRLAARVYDRRPRPTGELLAKDKVPHAIERYTSETKRIVALLDQHLSTREYLEGEYSVADISHFGWFEFLRQVGVSFSDAPNVVRWLDRIAMRTAVARGMRVPLPVR